MDSLNAGHLLLKRSTNIPVHCSTNSRMLKVAGVSNLQQNIKHIIFTHSSEAKAMLQAPRDSCLLGCTQKYLLLKLKMYCLYLSLAEIHLLSHSSHCISMYTEDICLILINFETSYLHKKKAFSILLVTTIWKDQKDFGSHIKTNIS